MAKKTISSGTIFDGNQKTIDKISRDINRELIKIQIPPIKIMLGKSWGEKRILGTPSERMIRCWTYAVKGSLPMVNGIIIHGMIEPARSSGKNIVSNFSKDIDIDYKSLSSGKIKCCECSNNSNREKAYLITSKEKGTETIGADCLEKRLGFKPSKAFKLMEAYRRLDKSLYEIKGEKGLSSRITDDTYLPLKEFLQHVLTLVEKKGYVTQKEGAMPTGRAAMVCYLNGPQIAYSGSMFKEMWGTYDNYNDSYIKSGDQADGLIRWASSLDEDSSNEYINNIRKIASDGWVAIKHANLAASIYHAHESRKYEASQANPEAKRDEMQNQAPFHLKCASVKKVNTKYGERYLHSLYNKDGEGFGIFSKERMMTPGKFYNIIADTVSPGSAKKMSSNLTIMKNISRIESATISSPNPLSHNNDQEISP